MYTSSFLSPLLPWWLFDCGMMEIYKFTVNIPNIKLLNKQLK